MASYTFDSLKSKMATAEITFDVPDGSYKVALVTSAVFANPSTGALSNSEFWNEVSAYEITEDVNYNTESYVGPENMTNVALIETDNSGYTNVNISATDIVYPISTIDANGAVVYRTSDGRLICAVDFGVKRISNQGTFTVALSNGFLQLI